jgi:hypothetical protein
VFVRAHLFVTRYETNRYRPFSKANTNTNINNAAANKQLSVIR